MAQDEESEFPARLMTDVAKSKSNNHRGKLFGPAERDMGALSSGDKAKRGSSSSQRIRPFAPGASGPVGARDALPPGLTA